MLQTLGLALVLAGAAQAPSAAALTDDTILALTRRAPAFAAKSGRAELTVVRKMSIPGSDDAGWFVELTWLEKGKRRTALAAVARTDIPDRSPDTWVVRSGQWGIASMQEDKNWDDLIRDLLGAKTAALQAAAVGRVRAMVSAQLTFSAVTGGFAGDVKCLAAPASCGVKGADVGFIDERFTEPETSDYRFTLHVGPPSKQAPKFFEAFAYTAVPKTPGLASYCADGTGRMCTRADGQAPRASGGVCMDPCDAVK